MEKGDWVRDIKANQNVSGIFLASGAQLAKTRNNRPYWRLQLADASGSIEAKIWQPLCEKIPAIPDGAYAAITATASVFNNALQLSLSAFNALTPQESQSLNVADFQKSSSRDVEAMFADLRWRCEQEFSYEPWRKFILAILDDPAISAALRALPAARTMHHAWAGGLLEHTCGVFGLCMRIADSYPELDRQTLLAGALLHDIGKIRELSSGPNTVCTPEGELFGHITLGLELISPFLAASGLDASLANHLRHMILSHHGLLEYGSPVEPKTAEALAVHYADNLDAKLAQFRQALEKAPQNEFTNRQNAFKRPLVKFPPTPAAESVIASEREIIQTDSEVGLAQPDNVPQMPPGMNELDEPPPDVWIEAYDGLVPEEDADAPLEFWEYTAQDSTWEEQAESGGKHKHAHKKAPKAERCSLV